MRIAIILLTLEILTFIVLRDHFWRRSKPVFYAAVTTNFLLSIILWYFFFRSLTFRGFYDAPENVWYHLSLAGMMCAVTLPRFLLSLFHYTGKIIRLRKGGHIRGITTLGFIISAFVFFVIGYETFIGRFNFKTEEITLKIKDLKPGLEGLRIVQISDLHLSGFYRHHNQLQKAMAIINKLHPDIILNTGDFVSYGWREFDGCENILSKAVGRYGNYAISGNHDNGTYLPGTTIEGKASNTLTVNGKITESGYRLLLDSSIVREIGGAKVSFTGVTTEGRHPLLTHGDLSKAMTGTDSADFKILLIHNPNHWEADVVKKTNIDLTFSGHTHGMQIGILTKKFRWSPSIYFYPHWNGLYSEGRQYQYVNRGLGVLSVPFRIWMPPEITFMVLKRE
ncbi:MAG: metallophosphoesterase [Bacteroidales bacterium]|jgi:hypothetical protein